MPVMYKASITLLIGRIGLMKRINLLGVNVAISMNKKGNNGTVPIRTVNFLPFSLQRALKDRTNEQSEANDT